MSIPHSSMWHSPTLYYRWFFNHRYGWVTMQRQLTLTNMFIVNHRCLVYWLSRVSCERHGLELWYHENGQIWRKRPYRYGKKHGLHEWYFKGNQILSRKTWKNGKRHGLHEKFDRTGYLISSKIYKDGKLVVSLFDMSQTE